jgi:hypothetical protein
MVCSKRAVALQQPKAVGVQEPAELCGKPVGGIGCHGPSCEQLRKDRREGGDAPFFFVLQRSSPHSRDEGVDQLVGDVFARPDEGTAEDADMGPDRPSDGISEDVRIVRR